MATLMTRTSTPEPLASVGFLSGCSPRELQRIQRHGTTVVVDEGAVVQPGGTRLQWVYLVLHGSVAATVDGEQAIIGSGEDVGVRSALTGDRAPAEIVALTRTTLFVLGLREFLGLVSSLPGLGLGVARDLVR